MSHKTTLTGNRRYREYTPLFGKKVVVLQVEERHTGYLQDMYGSGPNFDYTSWRDATVQDITVVLGEQ